MGYFPSMKMNSKNMSLLQNLRLKTTCPLITAKQVAKRLLEQISIQIVAKFKADHLKIQKRYMRAQIRSLAPKKVY
jgi:hypothetical protein